MKSKPGGHGSQAPTTRTIWLPEGFDVHDLPAGLWGLRKPIEILLSRIKTSAVASDREGFTPIRWIEAENTFGRRQWKRTRDWIEEIGLIECDHESRPNEKAYHYRLGEKWRGRPSRRRKIDDPEMLRLWLTIRGRSPQEDTGPTPIDPVRDHLNRWLRAITLDPSELDRGMASIDGKGSRRKGETTEEAVARERRHYAEMIVEMSREADECEGDYCDYGRFHSLVTRMPRWMRGAIRIDGRPMAEVDIRATQPLIQAILAAHHRTQPDHPQPPARTAPPPPHTIDCTFHTDAWSLGLPSDLADFFRDYPTTDFYRWVAPRFGLPCETDEERQAVKEAWAWIVYDRPRWHMPEWRRQWEAYQGACPSIAAWLEATKRANYRDAARTCQRFESRLMIQEVCGHLLERHPELPILTVHDAILSPPDGLDAVIEAIRGAWLQVGVEPALKVKTSA